MAQQIGAAFGLAVFTTVAVAAANRRAPGATAALQEGTMNDSRSLAWIVDALTHGYTTAFFSGAALLLIAAVIVIVMITTRRTQQSERAVAAG
jgi:NADH:ubiquinone oxidoreductase subunit 6 (subunit J)